MPRIHVGTVARAHGLQGELRLHTFDHHAPSLRSPMPLHLGRDQASTIRHEVTELRRASDGILVRLADVNDRTTAEGMRGLHVYVDAEELPGLAEGEHWAFQLAGCAVVDESGAKLGEVEDVTAGTAHDFLVVRTPAGRFEVPIVAVFVLRIDETARQIVLRPIPGLLDDGAEES